MKFGIAFANIITFAERDGLVALAPGAEAAGTGTTREVASDVPG